MNIPGIISALVINGDLFYGLICHPCFLCVNFSCVFGKEKKFMLFTRYSDR